MPNYRRLYVPGASYFFTVNLHDRSQSLLVDHIAVLRESIETVQKLLPFTMDAFVILPDHLHAIWTLPAGDTDYSTRWKRIKAQFSRQMPKVERRSASRINKHERGIWQRRFWEHTIRDDCDYENHVNYIHFNPVKHGYVKRPIDWKHSSLHAFVEKKWLSATWGTGATIIDLPYDV